MEAGCQLIRALELTSGISLREHLAIKNQKQDILGK